MKKLRGIERVKKFFVGKGPKADIQIDDYIIKFKKCKYIQSDVNNSHRETKNTREYLR